MKTILVVGLIAILGALYLRYETLAPCGALRGTMKRVALVRYVRQASPNDAAVVAGNVLAISTLDNVVAAATAPYGPLECTRALLNLEVNGRMPIP